jgi:hypothetical protein
MKIDTSRLFEPFESKVVLEILNSHNLRYKGKPLKVDQNKIGQWQKRKLIESSTPADGRGYRHKYKIPKICQIIHFIKLNDAGMTRAESSKLAFHKDTEKIFETIFGLLCSPNALAKLKLGWEYAEIVNPGKTPSVAPLTLGIYTRDDQGEVKMEHVDETSQHLIFGTVVGKEIAIVVDLSDIVIKVIQQMVEKGHLE